MTITIEWWHVVLGIIAVPTLVLFYYFIAGILFSMGITLPGAGAKRV